MATNVMMEALSPTMEEGRLVKWLKNVGDVVKVGDTLAEVETDKAIMELVARGAGVLRARLVDEDTTSPIGAVIAIIGTPDESISGAGGKTETPAGEPQHPTVPREVQSAGGALPLRASAAAAGPTRSSPLARRLAKERGLELGGVQGTGPNGRVIRRDIDAVRPDPAALSTSASVGSSASTASPAAAVTPIAPAAVVSPAIAVTPSSAASIAGAGIHIVGEFKDVALTQIRKTIARRLGESLGPIPTFFLTSEIDMTRVTQLREQMLAAGDQFKVSVNDIVIKAVAIALTRHPECNAHWMGDAIRYFSAVHIGMAVATDDGLIVPVIRDAHTKGLAAIGRDSRELAKKARERKIAPAEFTGGTFSVSNLGMLGIDQFTAIINPPEAAILAVGATETKPVWENGAFVPRQRMRVTLSCDHRIIDGAVGAKFLATVRLLLEAPLMMLF